MNGGKVISPRALYPRFGEAVGKVFGVDWLFGLDETDPWVKTWRANSNVVFHASYILQVASKRVDQALVPMRNFIIGSAGPQIRHFSPDTLPEPWRDQVIIRPSPLAKITGSSVPLDAQKLSGWVSPLGSPIRDSRVQKSPYVRRSTRPNTPPSIGLARQSNLVDSLALYDSSEQLKRDRTPIPSSQIPLAPTVAVTASLCQDYPRIDLVALVREKRKAKETHKKKLSVFPLQKEPHRRVDPRDSSYERFSHLDFNARGSRRDSRKLADRHARRSLALKERSISVRPVPRIFKPVLPLDCGSVFDDVGGYYINGRGMNSFPFVL
ncbi:hypothetical protein BDM02DRAFT_3115077 [Thelephora ganbajun]|uniref:Uncharacterized protein n=1 Tax=Thelephora ganbajun TaxID=370292 RepID=A0ACB6ZGT2_THEGA|nr:hypothetical protein BDM02DRAFT_3115077 [Thelephora ganbajun]